MIATYIAYIIAGVLTLFGLLGIVGYFFDKKPDRENGVYGGVLFLIFAYLAAWMGGI